MGPSITGAGDVGDDVDLAAWLEDAARTGVDALIVANGYTTRLLTRSTATDTWKDVHRGEFGAASLQACKPLVKAGRLLWLTTKDLPELVDVSKRAGAHTSLKVVTAWVKNAEKLTQPKGRLGEAAAKTCEEIEYLAASCCQFEGCGEDLRTHTATGQHGRFTYFAHIVAASADGPRGHRVDSKELSGRTDNFLLLCDACHRLIDRVNPGKYTTAVLREMRERSIAEVRRLRATLKHERVDVIAIIGNISGQPAHFSVRDANEALWAARLRSTGEIHRLFASGNQHDPHSDDYWASLFRGMRGAPRLQSLLNGNESGGAPRPKLAVFAQHGTSVLVMAGRILGDVSGTHVFQPHRNVAGELTASRWVWPATTQPAAAFICATRKDHAVSVKESCLIVSLTFELDYTRLPSSCFESGALKLPTIEVLPATRGTDIIRRPTDLVALGTVLDDAVRKLQDEWRVDRVHLFVGAPASATLLVGQKMQARNQAVYICHEATGKAGPFLPTIEISTSAVTAIATGETFPLQP